MDDGRSSKNQQAKSSQALERPKSTSSSSLRSRQKRRLASPCCGGLLLASLCLL